MEIKWPIFIRDRDGWMNLLETITEAQVELEEIDIIEQEYNTWDMAGQVLQFYLDGREIKVNLVSNVPQLDKLKEAILNYAKLARPKTPFVYSGPENNMVALYKAVEEHINAGRLRNKIKKFFTKRKK